MKSTQKLTFSGIMASLSVILMLCGYFPYLTYAVPAVSGLFVMVCFIEAGASYGLGAYIVSGVLSLFIAEKEVAVLYLLLFGYYPIVKSFIEKRVHRVTEWIIKLCLFNAAALLSYFAASRIFGISFEDFGVLGKYGAVIFLVLCNFAFVLYDIAIARIASLYLFKFHERIKRVFK